MKDKLKKIFEKNNVQFEFIALPADLPPDVESHMKFHGHSMEYAMPNIVFKTNKGFIVVQRRGDTKIDSKKLKKVAKVSDLRVATEEELKALDLIPGIVPPVGIDAEFYMDEKIFDSGVVYSGTGDKLFALKFDPKDLKKINNPVVGDFTVSKNISPGNKIVFSGIQPSGNLHIGNYIGSINQWVKGQDNPTSPRLRGTSIFCIVDMHAITTPQDPTNLHAKTLELAAIYLASGIDPEKSIIFVQSHNPDHVNLGWILNNFVSMGQLNRMTQYKEKSESKEFVSAGLFDYPVLMAADILLYGTTEVPVGEDQKQHVELARDIAEKFNAKLGDTFTLPKPVIPKTGGRIMSLVDPTKKMSKSDPNPNATIYLLDNPHDVRKKLSAATTDSSKEIKYDRENKPGISNLIEIYKELTNKSVEVIEKEFVGVSYKDFKEAVGDSVIDFLLTFQEKYKNFKDEELLLKILKDGAKKAYKISHPKLMEVYKKVGFVK